MSFTLMITLLSLVTVANYPQLESALASWTAVHQITISGFKQVSRDEILSLLALPQSTSLLSINSQAVESRIQQHPRVAHASVSKDFPHTLVIHITERQPAAMLRFSGGGFLLDEQGQVLSTVTDTQNLSLAVLTGMSPLPLLSGEPQSRDRVKTGIQLATLLSEEFDGELEINLHHPDYVMVDAEDLRLHFGANFEEQWGRYLSLQTSLQPRIIPHITEVDLRYLGKIILRKRE